jgi:hypothetical protein
VRRPVPGCPGDPLRERDTGGRLGPERRRNHGAENYRHGQEVVAVKQYTKNKMSVWYNEEKKKIGFQFHKHGSIDFINADEAVVVFAMLCNAVKDYFTDYPPKANS